MRRRFTLAHDAALQWLALAGGLPGVVVALALLWTGDASTKVRVTLTLGVLAVWWGVGMAVRERVARPLQTLSNVLAALREGDFSVRGRSFRPDDPLGAVLREANQLADGLREQRLGALEADALLGQVMEEIDVAILAFDSKGVLRLVNRAGEHLLGGTRAGLVGRDADALGVADLLEGESPRRLARSFSGSAGGGPYELRRRAFRQSGQPHVLAVVADVGRALREEERQAWKRLVRVLGHEINNSLAPIHSIAAALLSGLKLKPRAEDWDEDAESGLAVVARRAESLSRFMQAYARLARLPAPVLGDVEVGALVQRVVALEQRLKVGVREGPRVVVKADGDQLEQLLINLVRNAVDAAKETSGGAWVSWRLLPDAVELWVEDEGPGLANPSNLFVPFFTTKPGGSGIGLALSRQIAEAHGGSLGLEQRHGAQGARARLRLPFNTKTSVLSPLPLGEGQGEGPPAAPVKHLVNGPSPSGRGSG